MRIVHVIFNLLMGGAETLLIDITRCQADEGHDVQLLLINNSHDPQLMSTIDPRIGVTVLGKQRGSRNPIWLWRYNRRLWQMHPDIVHIHNERAMGMLHGPRRYQVVFTYHGLGSANPWAAKADLQCSISRAVQQDVTAHNLGNSVIVPNGIVTGSIAARPKNAPHRPLRLIQVGRLEHRAKGQDITLQALAARPDLATVDFVGDGPSRQMLKAMAEGLGLADSVRFLGTKSRKDTYAMLSHYDGALLTSRSEGFGLTLAEAAVAGLPIISCDLAGPLEVVDGGRLATTFRTGDVASLVSAIERLSENYDQALALTDEARRFVEQNFSIGTTARSYLEEYSKIKLNTKH